MTSPRRGAASGVRLRDVTLDDADLLDAWNLPEARGQGHGTDAQALLAAYLFENTDVNRIEAQTDTAQFRAGTYHDLVTYSILRDET